MQLNHHEVIGAHFSFFWIARAPEVPTACEQQWLGLISAQQQWISIHKRTWAPTVQEVIAHQDPQQCRSAAVCTSLTSSPRLKLQIDQEKFNLVSAIDKIPRQMVTSLQLSQTVNSSTKLSTVGVFDLAYLITLISSLFWAELVWSVHNEKDCWSQSQQ